MGSLPDIFGYEDYRKFLKDWLDHSRGSYGFSYRIFSKRAGFRSPSVFKMVMDGDRNLTEASSTKFIKALRLTEMQGCYFRYLVHAAQAVNETDRRRYAKGISALKEFRHRLPEIESQIERLREKVLKPIQVTVQLRPFEIHND